MKYHSSLLKKYISVQEAPEDIARELTLKTCEIEEIIERKITDSIVIGYTTSCEKHPEADRLSVCVVNCGDKGEYQIICGGSNIAAGLYVPVALPGTYFAKADMTIEKRKMRGIESNGMICSKEELDILEDMDAHGIWDLKQDFDDISDEDLGTPLENKYPRLNSYVLDVDNKCLTNRPDLTGHFGAAIELHAIYHTLDKSTSIAYDKTPIWTESFYGNDMRNILEHATPALRSVRVESPAARTYTLIEINNITLQKTSFFTRLQMIDMGANPRNNWVDFSNLFMLLSGQPIHFFDADKVHGDIIVRNAKDGEQFVDLFEATHTLKHTDLVIADQDKILALAGVVGGLDSGISDTTKNILVEIANFDPVSVRKTGVRLGLRTDAELRYEKHINPRWSAACLLLFMEELKYYAKDLGTFEQRGIAYYISPELTSARKFVPVNFERLEGAIFGTKQEGFAEKAEAILNSLGCQVGNNEVRIPIWRSPDDLNIAEDLTEEVVRIYGYEKVEGMPLLSDMIHAPYTPFVALQRSLEDVLSRDLDATQTECYPWISEKVINQFHKDISIFYSLENAVNPETPYLRDSLLYPLLAHAAKNSKFFDHFTIFDIGKSWSKEGIQLNKEIPYAYASVGEHHDVAIMSYQKSIQDWSQDPLLDAKNMIKVILKKNNITSKMMLTNSEDSGFHPKKQAKVIVGGVEVGFVGAVHPLLLKEYKIPENAGLVFISLSLEKLLSVTKSVDEQKYSYETLQDQILWRDLCFVVDKGERFDAVVRAVSKVPEVAAYEVFDLYEGDRLDKGKKSVSIKIKINGDGNMTTEAINAIMTKTISAAEKAGGVLRA
ncbi:MAG: phenylalanine--tRNA ligase subunit beta [Candidatus Absconditabacteria bacterium]